MGSAGTWQESRNQESRNQERRNKAIAPYRFAPVVVRDYLGPCPVVCAGRLLTVS
jgi:hypothetical protein